MSNTWKRQTWGDLVTLEYGKGLRGYESGAGPFPVFGTNGLIGWHDAPLCPHPGVIVGRKGAYRGIHYSKLPFYVIDTAFFLKPKTKVNLKWVYYSLLTYDINSMDSGSAIPSTSRDEFYALPVKVPPIQVQDNIVEILSSLDDKIELNRKINETLEAIARAIFKSWFIDFDPVRAKMEGRKPEGVDEETASLFPGNFQGSVLGDIPTSWHTSSLAELCTTQYGYTASGEEASVGPKLLRVKDINKTDWIEWDDVPHCVCSEINIAKYRLQRGDLVVARMADPGKSAIVDIDINAVFASYLIRLKTRTIAESYFVYYFLKSHLFRTFTDSAKSGSVQANMNAKVIVSVPLVVPPPNLIQAFYDCVIELRQRLACNLEESRSLASIRDLLLPRLLTGQVKLEALP